MSTWTPELYEEMKQSYLARMEELPEEDRAKHSAEVVQEIATDKGFTVNAFRMKLSRDGVYIKKEQAKAKAATGEGAKSGGSRTSKADAQSELIAALTDGGVANEEIDMAIVEKLTGKASQHLAALIRKITK
ncbi:D3 protein [Serratia phage Slocum]|nr:D3 protein [Serratia phage Slocum]URC22564.1 hypothetical protein KAMAJI_01360 [Serratia phage vB_SmaM-Kamaji]